MLELEEAGVDGKSKGNAKGKAKGKASKLALIASTCPS
jgi:hypothetical protein